MESIKEYTLSQENTYFINKIKKIMSDESLWSCDQNDITVKFEDPQKKISSIIHQNELSSIYTQIKTSNINQYKTNEKNDVEKFQESFLVIIKLPKIIKYLNSQNVLSKYKTKTISLDEIDNSFKIEDQKLETILNDFGNILSNNCFYNCNEADYLTDFVSPSEFYTIGKTLQTDDQAYQKLQPYMISIAGKIISQQNYENFLNSQSYNTLFDICKFGRKFCEFLYENHSLEINLNIGSILNSDDEFSRNFPSKITKTFSDENIIFIKVQHLVHCFHCILSLGKIISSYKKISAGEVINENSKGDCIFNRKTLIFCQKDGNFVEKINRIPKEDVNNPDLTYVIVHPELLNQNDQEMLIYFINNRMKLYNNKKLAKVMIISSLDFTQLCSVYKEKINHCEIEINNKLLKHFYDLSLADSNNFSYQIYFSEIAGIGKSSKIAKYFEKNINCIQKDDHYLKRLYIDGKLKHIPSLKNGQKNFDYVHFDLSPEIFVDNIQIFDQLWSLAVLHSHVYPEGSSHVTPSNIFFEIPTIDEFVKDGVFLETEFPISVHHINKITVTEQSILIPKKLEKYCEILFKDKISFAYELIEKTAEVFYPSYKLKKSWIDLRLLNQFISFIDHFCEEINTDDEVTEINQKLALFILFLRTNFHIWKMESIFEGDNKFSSFIILVQQNLFSSQNRNNLKWNLLSFISRDFDTNDKWDTKYFNDYIINKLGDVQDSNYLEKDLFSFLLNSSNIDIYSNDINYDNEQSSLFNIICSCFYHNSDNTKNYCKLVDGVILNKFKQSQIFNNLRPFLFLISSGKSDYEKEKIPISIRQWNIVFDALYNISWRYPELNCELSRLIYHPMFSSDNVNEITNISLTINIVKRFVIMLIRIILNQPVIFEGSTGVGKTIMMRILKIMVDAATMDKNVDFNWAYHKIDCNSNFTIEKFEQMKNLFYKSAPKNPNQIIFLDQLNSSSALYYIVNEMNQSSKTNNVFSTTLIAAVNPYVKFDKSSQILPLVGYYKSNKEHEVNKLVYDVKKLPESAKIYVINSDPTVYTYTEEDQSFIEQLNNKNQNPELLPPEEMYIIRNIIAFSLNSLLARVNNPELFNIYNRDKEKKEKQKEKKKEKQKEKKKEKEKEEEEGEEEEEEGEEEEEEGKEEEEEGKEEEQKGEDEEQKGEEGEQEEEKEEDEIESSIYDNKEDIIEIILTLISTSFIKIRKLIDFKSVFTYRDVKQCMELFSNFFRKLINVFLKQKDKKEIMMLKLSNILVEKIVPQSIVLSIVLSICFRFSNDSYLELNDPLYELLKEFADKKDKKYNFRCGLINILSKIEWKGIIKKPKQDWNNIVKLYSWLKCIKYIYPTNIKKKKTFNPRLLKTESLINNLFAISSCYSATKNSQNDILSCSLIGPQGSSKNLALQLFLYYKQSKDSQKVYNATYLCTKQCTEESLSSKYQDCEEFMNKNANSLSICSIENLSIEDLTDKSVIQSLHYYMEKRKGVMPFITTNHSLDYATMNRSIQIINPMPSDDELAYAFYFSELEFYQTDIIKDKETTLKNKFFNDKDIFKFEKLDGVHKGKYKKFLSKMWKLTIDHERPKVFPLQPIYLIFNSLFHNNKGCFQEIINNLYLYFNSIQAFDTTNLYDVIKSFLNKLHKNPYVSDDPKNNIVYLLYMFTQIDSNEYMKLFMEIYNGKKQDSNYKQFRQAMKKSEDEFIINLRGLKFEDGQKAIQSNDRKYYKILLDASICAGKKCFRSLITNSTNTNINIDNNINYSIFKQNINSLQQSFCIETQRYECLDLFENLYKNVSSKNKGTIYHKIFPQNQSMQTIINIIQEANKNHQTTHFILIIGNFSFYDSLYSLFNYSDKIMYPILSFEGFTIQLNEFPKNIYFCFIKNQDKYSNPLISKLNSFYLDYKTKDENNLIENYDKFNEENIIFSTPYASYARQYVSNFFSKIRDIEVPKEEKEFAVVFSLELNDSHSKDKMIDIYNLNTKSIKFKWSKKKIILQINNIEKDFDLIKSNFAQFKNESEQYKIIYYWTPEFLKFYNSFNDWENIQIPRPSFNKFLDRDGSIDFLPELDLIKERLENNNKHFNSIILTTSPISEELNYESHKNITKENSVEFYNSDFNNLTELIKIINECDKGNTKYIIIRLNEFDEDYDRYIRHILNTNVLCTNLIIIYHLKDNQVPDSLCTSEEWPVFWIESITKSHLSSCSIANIINCALLNDKNNKPTYLHILHQIYDDIDKKFDQHIEKQKVDLLIEHIYDRFMDKNMFNTRIIGTKLIDELSGKIRNDSYKYINIKRYFTNEIEKKYPLLKHLIEILILGFDFVNAISIDDTKSFIDKIIELKDFDDLFVMSEINERNYPQFNNNCLFFPELILPLALHIYKIFENKSEEDYPKYTKSTFDIFLKLQQNQENDNISVFCNNYFKHYLIEYRFHIVDDFDNFINKLKSLL